MCVGGGLPIEYADEFSELDQNFSSLLMAMRVLYVK